MFTGFFLNIWLYPTFSKIIKFMTINNQMSKLNKNLINWAKLGNAPARIPALESEERWIKASKQSNP